MKKWLLVGLLLVAGHASAGQWVPYFRITNLFLSTPENFHYRVEGMPTVSTCTNATNWAYINESDPGSKTYIAVLTSAFAMEKPVALFVEPVNGYCHILEMQISSN